MTEVKERVIEDLAVILADQEAKYLKDQWDNVAHIYLARAKKILSDKRILIKDPNQSLPTVEWTASPNSTPSIEFSISQAFREAYKDWVKPLKEKSNE